MTHSLTLGSLELTGDAAFPDDEHGFWFEVAAEGTEFGSPEAVTSIVSALMTDGDLVRYDRDGNRTIPIRVRVLGPTLGAVANGEAALRRESRVHNRLVWQPPDEFAPASTYRTYPSPMRPVQDSGWDLDEKLRRSRTVSLALNADPYAFSAEQSSFSFAATPGATVSQVITTADVTTGWSATGGQIGAAVSSVSVTDQGAYVQATYSGFRPMLALSYDVANVSMTTTRYLRVEVSGDSNAAPKFSLRFAGSGEWKSVTPEMSVAIGSGVTAHYLDTQPLGSVLTGLRLTKGVPMYGSWTLTIGVHDVTRTNTLQQLSLRQVTNTFQIGGTERTAASLRVKSSTGGDLKHTLVASWPERSSGFAPPMRRWRAGGNATPDDAATISGKREAIGPTAVSFGVPASSIPPGAYQLVGRLRSVGATGSLNIYWSAGTSVQSVLLDGEQEGSVDASFPVAGQWEIVPLGTLILPVIAASNGDLFIGINHAGSSQVEYDELWLLPVGEDCAISAANVDATHLWLDEPGPGQAQGAIRIGNTDDRANARHPGLGTFSPNTHYLRAGAMTFFVASLTDNPQVDGLYTEAWPSNAAR